MVKEERELPKIIHVDGTVRMDLITFDEARKISVIKTKNLEDHLLMRLREYQVNLVNANINPAYYDYDKEYLIKSINSIIRQLKGEI